MNNKKFTILVSIISVLVFVIAIATASFAFYTAVVKQEGDSGLDITTSHLGSSFIDGPVVQKSNIIPGDTITKTFTVGNNGGNEYQYKIVINEVQNDEFEKPEDLQYTLKYILKTEDGEVEGTFPAENGTTTELKGTFPTQTSAITGAITIGANEIHSYSLTIEYKNTAIDQSNDMGKTISGKIFIEEVNE